MAAGSFPPSSSGVEGRVPPLDRRRSLIAGALIGASLMAAVDTVVFHQLLGWHHFYDRSTSDIGLLSDGLLQTAYLVALVGGFFLFADLRRRQALDPASTWAAAVAGLGGFQLFDGLVDHKVLRVHQIRYGVDALLPYDLAWNLGGAALLLVGLVLVRRSGRRSDAPPRHPDLTDGRPAR